MLNASLSHPFPQLKQGSDEDTLGQHPHFAQLHSAHPSHGHGHGSPASLPLDRSASIGRRSSHFSGLRGAPAAASSPRTVSLKVKSSRARPAAAMAAAHAAGEDARMPARHAARRSMALSTAALAEEAAFSSDSEGEPAGAAVERRSGHGASGAASASPAAAAAGANGKKKHNPWSLAETEALVDGVRLLGPSKWAEIKKLQVGCVCVCVLCLVQVGGVQWTDLHLAVVATMCSTPLCSKAACRSPACCSQSCCRWAASASCWRTGRRWI